MKNTTVTTVLTALLMWPSTAWAQVPDAARGAEVWAQNCVRCHNARPPAERTDGEWLVIVNHMRARANLTRTQARLVTSFLQATNAPPAVVPTPPATPTAGSTPDGEAGEVGAEEAGATEPELSEDMLRLLSGYIARLFPRVTGPAS